MARSRLEKELIQRETQYWQAIKDRDAEAAMRVTDDFCLIAGTQGVARFEKQMMASMLRSARYTLERFELKDPQVQLIGDDVAVLAYSVHEELTVDGQALTLESADASTWIRRPEGWKCALHTESNLADSSDRDRHSG